MGVGNDGDAPVTPTAGELVGAEGGAEVPIEDEPTRMVGMASKNAMPIARVHER
jgi:hypothetical protein